MLHNRKKILESFLEFISQVLLKRELDLLLKYDFYENCNHENCHLFSSIKFV